MMTSFPFLQDLQVAFVLLDLGHLPEGSFILFLLITFLVFTEFKQQEHI